VRDARAAVRQPSYQGVRVSAMFKTRRAFIQQRARACAVAACVERYVYGAHYAGGRERDPQKILDARNLRRGETPAPARVAKQ